MVDVGSIWDRYVVIEGREDGGKIIVVVVVVVEVVEGRQLLWWWYNTNKTIVVRLSCSSCMAIISLSWFIILDESRKCHLLSQKIKTSGV